MEIKGPYRKAVKEALAQGGEKDQRDEKIVLIDNDDLLSFIQYSERN